MPFWKRRKEELKTEIREESPIVCEIVGASEDMLVFRCHPRMERGPSCIVVIDSEGIKAPSTPICQESVEYLKNIKLFSFTKGVKGE
ncbi:TPA: hypothetical protein EYP70_04065 [Candidatus Bathyarchaeota archaeon]|nr:hypothetical protein [Candidatus Bathyarchaeota archaeon]